MIVSSGLEFGRKAGFSFIFIVTFIYRVYDRQTEKMIISHLKATKEKKEKTFADIVHGCQERDQGGGGDGGSGGGCRGIYGVGKRPDLGW